MKKLKTSRYKMTPTRKTESPDDYFPVKDFNNNSSRMNNFEEKSNKPPLIAVSTPPNKRMPSQV